MRREDLPREYQDASLPQREQSAILAGSVQVASCMTCCHCGKVFVVVKGSGTLRGFCRRCMHVTCGDSKCDPCAPLEARLEEAEGKITPYHDTIVDSGFIL